MNIELKCTRVELNDLLRRRAEFIMHRVRQNYYFNGSRPSRLLALKLKQSESRASIDAIRSPTKGMVSDPKEINATFHTFYQDLYKSADNFEPGKCKHFLNNLNLPSLGEQEAADLGRPISLIELETALKLTNKR